MRSIQVLHLAPHPDDESIAAPGTLLGLHAAGHLVTNVVCSLGRPGQRERRAREAREASRRAGFQPPIVLDPPLAISRGDDLAEAQGALADWLVDHIDKAKVDLVVSPSPHDGHHGHEVVGRAAREGIERSAARPRWWLWALWADLPLPTLITVFDDERMEQALYVLGAYPGELERNNYADLVRCRAVSSRVLGAERVFGFGRRGIDARYAELFTELALQSDAWMTYGPRLLDPSRPLDGQAADIPLDWWLDEPSFRNRLVRAQLEHG